MSEELFKRSDENVPKFLNGIFSFSMGYNPYTVYTGSTSISDDNLYRAMSDLIHSLAEKSSCVIVGRSSDYVLRDHPRCINVFVDSLTEQQARSLAEKTNKLRAGYYNFYTDKTWGDAKTYDLTIDSSTMPMDDIAEVVCDYVRRRLADAPALPHHEPDRQL